MTPYFKEQLGGEGSQHDTLTLEPCPFCGNEAHFVDDLIIVYAACTNCGATGAHSSYKTGAASAWNRRATISATQPAQAAQGEPVQGVPDGWREAISNLLSHIEDVVPDNVWEAIDAEKWNAVSLLTASPTPPAQQKGGEA